MPPPLAISNYNAAEIYDRLVFGATMAECEKYNNELRVVVYERCREYPSGEEVHCKVQINGLTYYCNGYIDIIDANLLQAIDTVLKRKVFNSLEDVMIRIYSPDFGYLFTLYYDMDNYYVRLYPTSVVTDLCGKSTSKLALAMRELNIYNPQSLIDLDRFLYTDDPNKVKAYYKLREFITEEKPPTFLERCTQYVKVQDEVEEQKARIIYEKKMQQVLKEVGEPIYDL